MPSRNESPRELTPDDILSFVEDEMRPLEASEWTADERAEMIARIRSRPADLALYEQFRSGVRALRSLPQLDAPASVWEQIEARFDETLEQGSTVITLPGAEVEVVSWASRMRRRIAVAAAAAACLLVAVVGAVWYASSDTGPSPSERILFVKADPYLTERSSEITASVAVAEFLTKVTQRYRGVSAEELDAILRTPSDTE